MKKFYCERCEKKIANRDTYILLGYNGNLCSICFEGLLVCLELSRSETIKLYMQPERLNPEDPKYKKALEICDSLNNANE